MSGTDRSETVDPTPATDPTADGAASPSPAQLTAGRVAAALVGLEAAIVAGLAVFYLVELVRGAGSDQMIIIMSVVTMAVFVLGLAYTAIWLWRRHPRAQAPALAANGLMVPLGIAMFQFAPVWLAGGLLALSLAVIAGVLMMGRLGD